jgi:hypothetical protein
MTRRSLSADDYDAIADSAEATMPPQKEKIYELRSCLLEYMPTFCQDAAESALYISDEVMSRFISGCKGCITPQAWDPSVAKKKAKQNGTRGALTLLMEMCAWRKKHEVGRHPKSLLMEAAKVRQLYVNGFDRFGRAIVIYTPTTETACPREFWRAPQTRATCRT